MRKKVLLFVITLLGNFPIISAQSDRYCAKTESENFADTIRFEFIKNKLIVPIIVDGVSKRYVFDTGAGTMIHSNFSKNMQYPLLRKDVLNDANGNRDSIEIVNIPELEIGTVKFKNIPVGVCDMPAFFDCLSIDGIIGSNILTELIIKIDTKNKYIIITDRKGFFAKDKGYSTPMRTDGQNMPLIKISPFKKVKEEVLFDTGDSDFYSLSSRNFLYFKSKVKMNSYIIDSVSGVGTYSLLGLENESMKYLIHTNDFQINNMIFSNLYLATTSNIGSRIGADILNYGSVILDFANHLFTFIPHEEYSKGRSISTSNSHYDFTFVSENGNLRIGMIFESSESYKMGLRKGDSVISINGVDIKNICDVYLIDYRSSDYTTITVITKDNLKKEYTVKNK
ncbi:hypothetical protein BN938_0650 [Mucinivorans hirudinis]|uniref:PDZ domain-containing protein n=1 Tax=Mucinivorans hirudinis TaxID=1433126 RepID=A0A060R6R6_9BACT|nr:hypothetical protein BN938_0650 [Mucinivorans hirudinis]